MVHEKFCLLFQHAHYPSAAASVSQTAERGRERRDAFCHDVGGRGSVRLQFTFRAGHYSSKMSFSTHVRTNTRISHKKWQPYHSVETGYRQTFMFTCTFNDNLKPLAWLAWLCRGTKAPMNKPLRAWGCMQTPHKEARRHSADSNSSHLTTLTTRSTVKLHRNHHDCSIDSAQM